MRRLVCIVLAMLLLLPILSGCGTDRDDGKIKIVCTVFPQYDWIKNILGDSEAIELSLIIRNGSDPHSYQPTAADIMMISDCDMIVMLGSDSESWANDALEGADNSKVKVVELATIEGMTLHDISSSSHTHGDHDHDHDHEDHDHGAFDEHVWLSLSNASVAVAALTEEICKLDVENAERYRSNSDSYLLRLSELDGEYREAVGSVPEQSRFILFADRFPFVYLLSDYGIEYQAAFDGCTTDVDADFDTVITLINEADMHGVDFIAVTESSDGSLARTVASSTKNKNIEILTFNSLQRVSDKEIKNGASYLDAMRQNLKALKTAIGA